MDTTRAVIGRGLEVKELLFDDEFVSFRIRGWKTGDEDELSHLIEEVARREGLVDDMKTAIQHVDNSHPAEWTYFLTSKSIARTLVEHLKVCRELKSTSIEPRMPLHSSASDTARRQFGGRLKVSWSDGQATGSAKVRFASAADANVFLRSYGVNTAFAGIDVAPVGVFSDRISSSSPDLPPLKKVIVDRFSKYVVFDERAIELMASRDVDKLQFHVRIRSGLPTSVDEERLMELMLPARVLHCRIDRVRGNKSSSEELCVRDCVAALLLYLSTTETASAWEDKSGHRVGKIVYFKDLNRVEQVDAALSASQAWCRENRNGPFGQPVRRIVEFTYRTSFAAQVYECFEATFTSNCEQARRQGIWFQCSEPQTQSNGQRIVVIRLGGRNRNVLETIVASLEAVVEHESVGGTEFDALYSRAGHLKTQEWLHDQQARPGPKTSWIQQDFRTRSFSVYGAEKERDKAIASLRQLAASIHGHDEVLDKIVRLDLAAFDDPTVDGVKAWLAAQPAVGELYHFGVMGDGSRVALAGSKTQINALLTTWGATGKVLVRDRGTSSRPDCGVCMYAVDDPVVQFAVCGHSFCLECIQPGITPTSRLPLKCPVLDCRRYICVKDVAKVARSSDFQSLVDTAVFDYVARHPDKFIVCPKPGCNQILQLAKVKEDKFLLCSSSDITYCLVCSKEIGSAIERHVFDSCRQFQLKDGTVAARHVRWIRDRILTLRCPHCEAAFLDFDGCMCVQCGNSTCKRYFCANCLEYSHEDSRKAHMHVRTCPKNPKKGEFFVPKHLCEKLHLKLRLTKLQAYFTAKVPSEPMRNLVMNHIMQDLVDLGFKLTVTEHGSNDTYEVSKTGTRRLDAT